MRKRLIPEAIMFSLSDNQIEAFEDTAFRRFEDEMVTHAVGFSPQLHKVIGTDAMRIAVSAAIERAGSYGFSFRGTIRLYVEAALLFGSGFDTDPQYAFLYPLLTAKAAQLSRAEQIFDEIVTYQRKVTGEDGARVRAALTQVQEIAKSPTYVPEDHPDAIIAELRRIFPEKADFIGASALLDVLTRAKAECAREGLATARTRVLVVALMYAFGHQCLNDPLYPWISKTLDAERFPDPEIRAVRLEKRAVVWLDHVLANADGEVAS